MTASTEDPAQDSPGDPRSVAIARELFRQPRYTDRPGLRRMHRFFADLSPVCPVIHVVGSNGKGSVATWTAEILRRCGLRTGLYTSPHLRFFGERFRVDGRSASGSALEAGMKRVRPWIQACEADKDPVLAFEAMTALAACVFEQAGAEVAVVEAGIGGRFDATKAFAGPWSVLVSVDLEHTAILGKTLEAIALDKAAIAAPGTELFLGDLEESLTQTIEEVCSTRGVNTIRVGEETLRASRGMDQMSLALELNEEPMDLCLGSPGRHQQQNAVLAVYAAHRSVSHLRPDLGRASFRGVVKEALEKTRLPARMERLEWRFSEIWLDGAHTAQAWIKVAETAEALASGSTDPLWTVVLGLSEDKAHRVPELLRTFGPIAARVILARAFHRGADPESLKQAALDEVELPVEVAEDLRSALEMLSPLEDPPRRVLVTGSLFLVLEARELLAGRDPRHLELY